MFGCCLRRCKCSSLAAPQEAGQLAKQCLCKETSIETAAYDFWRSRRRGQSVRNPPKFWSALRIFGVKSDFFGSAEAIGLINRQRSRDESQLSRTLPQHTRLALPVFPPVNHALLPVIPIQQRNHGSRVVSTGVLQDYPPMTGISSIGQHVSKVPGRDIALQSKRRIGQP